MAKNLLRTSGMRTRHALTALVALPLIPVVALFTLLLIPVALLLLPVLAVFSVMALLTLVLSAEHGTEPAAHAQPPVSGSVAYSR